MERQEGKDGEKTSSAAAASTDAPEHPDPHHSSSGKEAECDDYVDDFDEENAGKQQEADEADGVEYEDDFETAQGPSPQKGRPAAAAPVAAGGAGTAATSGSSSSSSAPRWDDAQPEDIKVGRQLGGGGFAVVFEGVYRGQRVAVKQIVDPSVDEETRQAFVAEALAQGGIPAHPNIVRLLAVCMRPPKQCYVMELCGPSLFEVLHGAAGRGKPVPLAQSLAWAGDAADALAFLHAQRPAVIHRDVKSHNLVVAGPGGRSCKLTDFGLVSTRVTAAGTPAYMAPELLGAKPFSKAVDVYAFGVLLWELVARQIPFAGWRPSEIRDAVLQGTRPDVREMREKAGGAGDGGGGGFATTNTNAEAGVLGDVEVLVKQCWAARAEERPLMSDVARRVGEMRQRLPSAGASQGAPGVGGGGGGVGGTGGGKGGGGGHATERGGKHGGDVLDALVK